jgi:hypothetical protein
MFEIYVKTLRRSFGTIAFVWHSLFRGLVHFFPCCIDFHPAFKMAARAEDKRKEDAAEMKFPKGKHYRYFEIVYFDLTTKNVYSSDISQPFLFGLRKEFKQ